MCLPISCRGRLAGEAREMLYYMYMWGNNLVEDSELALLGYDCSRSDVAWDTRPDSTYFTRRLCWTASKNSRCSTQDLRN